MGVREGRGDPECGITSAPCGLDSSVWRITLKTKTLHARPAPHSFPSIILSVVLALTIFLASCGASGGGASANDPANDCEKANTDLKVGFDTSLTGGTADLGEGQRKGFKLALKEYNARGGYKGKKVTCVILDDGTKPENGSANITRLIDQDKVVGVIAFANTGVANGALDKVQQSQVPLIIPVATGSVLTQKFADQPKNYVFRLSMQDIKQVAVMLTFLDKQNFSKPAIMHDVTGYGTLGRDDIVKGLAEKGKKPVEVQSFQIGDTDMTGQVQKAKAAGADVIMTYALAPELANLLKSLDRIGWYPPIVGSWTLAQPDMVKFATPDVIKKFKIHMVQSFTVDRDEASKAYNDKVVKEYGSNPVPITSAQAYDAASIMLAAIDKVGPDPKAIRDAIEATDGFKGVTTAPAKPYDQKNHEAIDVKDMFIAVLQDNGKGTIIPARAK